MKKEKPKCYACRKEVKEGRIFCKACEKKKESRKHTVGTLVIYHTV